MRRHITINIDPLDVPSIRNAVAAVDYLARQYRNNAAENGESVNEFLDYSVGSDKGLRLAVKQEIRRQKYYANR